jgi:hypothetical protein
MNPSLQDMPPVWADHTAVVACWLVALLFAVVYSLKAPWWATWMGRNLFFFDVAVAAALTPGVLKYLFGVNPAGAFYAWFLVADLAAVTLLVLHRGYLLLRVQAGWNWYPLRKILGRHKE